ncbi:MAG: hypothetical protein KF849_07815, partial [Rhizobiaceae bacterium]|nr:hypothetical protein [Rhizobiaceae bacterium]
GEMARGPGRKTIDRDEMYRLLLAASPSLADAWADQIGSWPGDPRALPDYPSLHSFALHAVANLADGSTGILDAVLRILRDGDETARRLVTAGIIPEFAVALDYSDPRREILEEYLKGD